MNLIHFQAYAATDRVASLHLDSSTPPATNGDRLVIPMYLLNESEVCILRDERQILIQRILVEYMGYFEDLDVCLHIPHEFLKESAQKSEIVCMPLYICNDDI